MVINRKISSKESDALFTKRLLLIGVIVCLILILALLVSAIYDLNKEFNLYIEAILTAGYGENTKERLAEVFIIQNKLSVSLVAASIIFVLIFINIIEFNRK
jgi:hypothetical protein